MRRKVHFWQDNGTIDFSPAPEGTNDISIWMSKKKLATLPTIDDDAVVERYVKAYREFCAAYQAVQDALE